MPASCLSRAHRRDLGTLAGALAAGEGGAEPLSFDPSDEELDVEGPVEPQGPPGVEIGDVRDAPAVAMRVEHDVEQGVGRPRIRPKEVKAGAGAGAGHAMA